MITIDLCSDNPMHKHPPSGQGTDLSSSGFFGQKEKRLLYPKTINLSFSGLSSLSSPITSQQMRIGLPVSTNLPYLQSP